MAEFTVAATTYRTKMKLNARQQFHIARRIAPVVSVIGAVIPLLQGALQQQTITPEQDDVDNTAAQIRATAQRMADLETLGRPIMEALASLPDADCDYVLDLCLAVVQRMQSGNGSGPMWSDIWNPRASKLMFEDIELPAMLQIAMEVLRENLMGFFSAPVTPPASDTSTTLFRPLNG
jgi:hypothetical protein